MSNSTIAPVMPTPVDPNSPKIQELAAWAVNAHNEQVGTKLVYVDAYKANKQYVNGYIYAIWLEATNGGLRGKHLAQVHETGDKVQLLSFELVREQNERVAVAN